jgi:RNA polymerase sigma factor (sigma-70 family)
MALLRPATLLRHLRRLAAPPGADPVPDADLLGRFVRQRDEAAFAALVARHGAMVQGVCRHVVGDAQAAEDCLQAVFLVLARRAASLRRPAALAAWLHGVALRVARKARADARRRPAPAPLPVSGPADPHADPLEALTARELLALLDEEIGRLPEACRLPVLLCCREGRTVAEAARLLGWTPGSVRGRLARGRRRLHARLARRGLTLAAALAGMELARVASAGVPALVAAATVRGALAFAADRGVAGAGVSSKVVKLAEGGLRSMTVANMKLGVALLLAASVLAAAAGAVAHQVRAGAQPGAPQQDVPEVRAPTDDEPNRERPPQTRRDRQGDPLPPAALLRLGTVRFRPGETVGLLAFSPDGRILASVGQNMEANENLNEVCLWDVTTGQCLRRFAGQRGQFLGAAISPNGEVLVTQDQTGAVRVWDVATGREVRRLTPGGLEFRGAGLHGQLVGAGFVFSPDGTRLAARGPDRRVHLWTVASGAEVADFAAGREDFGPVAFSPDGKTLAVAADGVIRLLGADTGKEIARLEGHEGPAGSAAFSADGKTLTAVARTPGEQFKVSVYAWDIAAGKLLHKVDAPGNPVFGCCLSPDGRRLLQGGYADGFRLLDATTGKEVRRFPTSEANTFAVAFSPDGETVAAAGTDRTIQLWKAGTAQRLSAFTGHQGIVESLALAPDGKTLASVGSERSVWLWDLATGEPRPGFRSPAASFSCVAFAPDGRTLAAASRDPFVRVLDADSGKELRRFTPGRQGQQGAGLEGQQVVVFSPDGALLAAAGQQAPCGRDPFVRVLEADSGKELRRFTPSSPVLCLAFSPDGKLLASGGQEETARVWETATGRLCRQLPGHRTFVSALAFSPDGRTLATASWDRTFRLWEVLTGKERCRLEGHADRVVALAFSPDGHRLASGSDDRTVRVWDAGTGEELGRFSGHRNVVGQVLFTPDGEGLISGSWDTTILVWDLSGLGRPDRPEAGPLTAREAEALWSDLAGSDAARAAAAVRGLARGPDLAVPFLRERLRPSAAPDAGRIHELIADLDSDPFSRRRRATEELTKLGELAGPALRRALDGEPAPEARRRIEELLGQVTEPGADPDRLRSLRALEVLERSGTPEARRLLESLARGAPEARLTQEAKASLQRLARRPAASP